MSAAVLLMVNAAEDTGAAWASNAPRLVLMAPPASRSGIGPITAAGHDAGPAVPTPTPAAPTTAPRAVAAGIGPALDGAVTAATGLA